MKRAPLLVTTALALVFAWSAPAQEVIVLDFLADPPADAPMQVDTSPALPSDPGAMAMEAPAILPEDDARVTGKLTAPLEAASQAVPALAESKAPAPGTIALNLDLDLDAMGSQSDFERRLESMDIPAHQPDSDVPHFTAVTAMLAAMAMRPELATPNNLAIVGVHMGASSCVAAQRLLEGMGPGQRNDVVQRLLSDPQLLAVPEFMHTHHRVLLPSYDDTRGAFVFPEAVDFGSLTDTLDTTLLRPFTDRAGFFLSFARRDDRCSQSSGGLIGGNHRLAGPIPMAPLEVSLPVAERLFQRAAPGNNRSERNLLAFVVSRLNSVSLDERGSAVVTLAPDRAHFYGASTDGGQPLHPTRYLVSYDFGEARWFYDLPVLDERSRLVGREIIAVGNDGQP